MYKSIYFTKEETTKIKSLIEQNKIVELSFLMNDYIFEFTSKYRGRKLDFVNTKFFDQLEKDIAKVIERTKEEDILKGFDRMIGYILDGFDDGSITIESVS